MWNPLGGASVLLQKSRSYAEVYNDVFQDIVNIFRVLRDPQKSIRLREVVELTPFARSEFESPIDRSNDVEWARGVIFRSYAGFGSGATNEGHSTGFRACSNRSGTTPAHDWANWPSHIQSFTERLRGVVIENRNAVEVMIQHDSTETLHYIDPPYMHATRYSSKRRVYNNEMTDAQHADLLEACQSLKGNVIVSGYKTDMYTAMLKDWRCVEFKALADGAKKRTECLWMNYDKIPTLF